MLSLRITSSQLRGMSSNKLWVNIRTLPHVVFATHTLGTTRGFMRSLSELCSQVYALFIYINNGVKNVFMHSVHTPNNSYNKGD